MLCDLHSDTSLRDAIARDAPAITCADAWLADYGRRYEEDLAIVGGRLPSFVSRELLEWIHDEVRELTHAVAQSRAWQEPIDALIHGDLWPGNVLVNGDSWTLLDWDEMRLGDAAHDFAKLLHPLAPSQEPAAIARELRSLLRADACDRLALHERSVLLDWILDPLADHVAVADMAPEHAVAFRGRKEREHREALRRYLELRERSSG